MKKEIRNTLLSVSVLSLIVWGVVTSFPSIENLRVVPLLSPSPMIAVPSSGPQTEESPSPRPRPSQSQVGSQGVSRTSKDRNFRLQSWDRFTEKFGSDLVPEFSKDGYLVAVRGRVGEGVVAQSSFDPTNPRMAIARAREILHAVSDLIGFQEEWPLENAAARSGIHSAQVFFAQTYEGVSVGPSGNVKIDLGPKGELIGLDSDYAAEITIANAIILDSEQAKQKVPLAFQKQENSDLISSVDGGGKVLWISGREARFAYQFSVNGQQVIIDAASGNVLFSKNRRHYFRS